MELLVDLNMESDVVIVTLQKSIAEDESEYAKAVDRNDVKNAAFNKMNIDRMKRRIKERRDELKPDAIKHVMKMISDFEEKKAVGG